MAPTGEAIGRADGLVLFVPLGLPGEVVEVEITHQRRNFAHAQLINVVTPSPQRVTPPCPYFGHCGGCQWQHIEYSAQVAFKTGIVREQLQRVGKVVNPTVRDCLPSASPLGYRNRIQLALSPRKHLGYRAERSHDIVEIEQCPIAEPAINDIVRDAPRLVRAATRFGEVELRTGTLSPDDETVQINVNTNTALYMTVEGLPFRVSEGAFSQVNTAMAEVLMQEVLKASAVQPHERVLDLYCGGGLFTWPLAMRCKEVLGVESSPIAIADARHNLAGLSNTNIIQGDVVDVLATQVVYGTAWEVIVLDPPRAGVERWALERLAKLRAPRLVYASCDPATLARDALYLQEQGYRLDYAQPLDMFPQTHHVETVAKFSRYT